MYIYMYIYIYIYIYIEREREREDECLLRGKNWAFKTDYFESLKFYTNTETGYHPEIYTYCSTIYFYRYVVLYECSGCAFLEIF